MKSSNTALTWGALILFGAWLASALTVVPATAQEQGAGPTLGIEEVVVIGSRRQARTVLESAVPIDVLSARDLRRQGNTDMDDVLRTLHPSYNVQRHGIDDEATLVRPITLRGLPPDNALVLVNGKRRHRSGVIALLGSSLNAGSQGPDLSVIPSIAIERIELLRDGAAAQYGADAIAGVLNLQLREDSEGVFLETRIGQYLREEDGEALHLAGNFGLPLTDRGFFNLSLDLRDVQDTVRSGTRANARALGAQGYPLADPAQIWGSPEVRDAWSLFFNSAIELQPQLSVYAFGGWHQREVEGGFFLRAPGGSGARSGVFRAGSTRLVAPRLDENDMEPMSVTQETCQMANLPSLASDFSAVEAYIAAQPNCFLYNELFPGGFTPRFGAEIDDWSLAAGAKGELPNGLRWDFSISTGRSEVAFFLDHSINASLGPDSPTSFRPRTYIQEELSLNLDFVRSLELGLFTSPLNVAFGFEWREESFESKAGNRASYEDGPYSKYGFSIGSNGYQGLNPDNAGEWDRPNWAAYLDLEADITPRLLLGFAVRYEDFYDDFGDTLKGKVAVRYELQEDLYLRGTLSTGFRAPSPGQANLSVLTTSFTDVGTGDLLVESGQLPPTHPVAAALGGEALEEEEAVNYSAGLAWRITERLSLTLDYFHIDVEDRIALTGEINLDGLYVRNCNDDMDDPASAPLVMTADCTEDETNTARTVSDIITNDAIFGGAKVRRVKFFANDFDTRTSGLDLVLSWSPPPSGGVDTDITLAWNWTKTEVEDYSDRTVSCFPRQNGGCDPLVDAAGVNPNNMMLMIAPDTENAPHTVSLLTPRRLNEIEDINPEHRIVLTSNHRKGAFNTLFRASFFSGWKACRLQAIQCPNYDSWNGGWTLDVEVGYEIDERLRMAFGVQNLLDEYPYVTPDETASQGNLHPPSTPWDYNGAFGYWRLQAEF